MIPVPIPSEAVTTGTHRTVIAGPDGDLTGPITAVEALVYRLPRTGEQVFMIRMVLEEDELARLQEGAPVWLTMLGHVVPFEVKVSS